jgi:hypothetical protein
MLAEDRFASDWGDLPQAEALPDLCPPLPRLDLDTLPKALRGLVSDVSERMQSSPEFVAVTGLCALGGVLGRKIQIKPKQHDDWAVTANFWGGMIGGPSSMKSPTMGECLKPLQRLESEARDSHASAMRIFAADEKLADIVGKQAEKKATAAAAKGEMGEAQKILLADMPEIALPARKRLLTNDGTVAKIGELLSQNPNGLLVVRDELAGLIASLSREDGQSDRAFYLECYNGNGRFTFDRIGRGTVEIEACCLSLVGGIQPARLAPLVRGTVSGADDDGLLQRFQLAVWPDRNPKWHMVDRYPDKVAKQAYTEAFDLLHGLPEVMPGEDPQALNFTAPAQGMFNDWYGEINRAARTGELHPALEAHLMKMPKTVAGLALMFELLDGGRNGVGEQATAMALEWADFLRLHAGRIYGAAQNQGLAGAHLMLERKSRIQSPFKARDITQKGWAGLTGADEVAASLSVLVDYGYLFELDAPAGAAGGRPTKVYRWRA